jgi:hypothetical protein
MSNYSDKASSVRVDFFRVRENGNIGKWYCTEAVEWTGKWEGNSEIYAQFAQSLADHLVDGRLQGMVAVCLEPYHAHSFPITMHVDVIGQYLKGG